jgi:hypothetical protein
MTKQGQAARNFIEALHAHKRGEITEGQKNAIGQKLNAAIAKHGKP